KREEERRTRSEDGEELVVGWPAASPAAGNFFSAKVLRESANRFPDGSPMARSLCRWTIALVLTWLTGAAPAVHALDAAAVKQLAAEDSDAKINAINKLVAEGDSAAIPLFKAMQDEQLYTFNGRIVVGGAP